MKAVVALVLLLSGCAYDPYAANIVGGAAIGGVAGNVISGGSAAATIGGAAIGGLIGNAANQTYAYPVYPAPPQVYAPPPVYYYRYGYPYGYGPYYRYGPYPHRRW
jgi:osmotically inducible lipoprotein OsmB